MGVRERVRLLGVRESPFFFLLQWDWGRGSLPLLVLLYDFLHNVWYIRKLYYLCIAFPDTNAINPLELLCAGKAINLEIIKIRQGVRYKT